MAEVGYATLGIIPSFKGFGTALERGSARQMAAAGVTSGNRFGDSAGQSAGRAFGSRFTSTLKRAGLYGGLASAFGTAAFIKDSVELEAVYGKTMAQIGVATEAPAAQLERLDEFAMRLGKDTVFSANEAAGAMLELAKNGISTATIEAGALESALTLAAAGGVDLTTSATTMGNALNAFQLKGKKAKSVAAALAGAANASSASVGSLAEGLQQSAATANDVGLNVQETTGILAAFANAGIAGSDAGTSLKTMLSRLNPQTEKAEKAMEKYGISFVTANGEFKNAVEIADQLRQGLGDLGAAERSSALNTIFGSDARRAATILTKEGAAGIREYIEATGDQAAADRMAKANMEGTAGAIERLKGSWETAQLAFGKALAPLAQDALDFLADSIDDVAPKLERLGDWLVDHTDEFATFGRTVGDIASRVGDLIGFLNDLPKEVKFAGLTGLLGAGALMKVRGGGSGGLGAAGSALGLARPVNVFVTNPGFGAAAGGGAVVGGDGKASRTAKGGRLQGKGGVLALLASIIGPQVLNEVKNELTFPVSKGGPLEREGAFAAGIVNAFEDQLSGADFSGSFGAFNEVVKGAENSAKQIVGAYSTLPKTLQTRFQLLGVPESEAELRHLLRVYDLTPREKRTTLELMGYDVMLDRIARVNRELDWAARPREARIMITKAYSAAGYETRGGLVEGGGGPVERNRSRAGGGLG